ncbi:hypothetical protein [Azospirillum argentinense]
MVRSSNDAVADNSTYLLIAFVDLWRWGEGVWCEIGFGAMRLAGRAMFAMIGSP